MGKFTLGVCVGVLSTIVAFMWWIGGLETDVRDWRQ